MKKIGLNELAKEIHSGNVKRGFWEGKYEIGTLLMLCVSELSEALEADRKDRFADLEAYEECEKANDILETDKEVYMISSFENLIKDTFEDEIADTMIRLFDLSAGLGIDIEKHIELKLKYNSTRQRKHGKKY